MVARMGLCEAPRTNLLQSPRADDSRRDSDSRNTSKACHAGGESGLRPRQATFSCSNDGWWIGKNQADVNGGIHIAHRFRRAESRHIDRSSGQKAGGNDSATDEASLIGPQDSQVSAETQQMTRGTHAV